MCGIAGFVDISGSFSPEESNTLLLKMTGKILHRGPDAGHTFSEQNLRVHLGFRRLAILDLSPTGMQPMTSHCGRYTIVFNGEIYNYKELKHLVEESGKHPYVFSGTSDTEVLLAAFSVFGIKHTLELANGMFAFALLDRELKSLILSRDKFGEKPLYYSLGSKTFFFGSELKALKAHPHFVANIERNVLNLYFRTSYIPAPYSIYENVYKLLPGTFITLNLNTGKLGDPEVYWSAKETIEKSLATPFQGTEEEALIELESLLENSIKIRMDADVPLGAFLSGGIDSSTVVALMQRQSNRPIKTFTMGFSEGDYNEAQFASKVAQHLKTDHTETIVTPQDALDVIPLLPTLYDEPFADSSQVPTYLVSKIARQKVTVALSGDGGDELFGGYHRYTWGKTAWKLCGDLPPLLKSAIARGIQSVPAESWNRFFLRLKPITPMRFQVINAGEKLQKLSHLLASKNSTEVYQHLVTHWEPRLGLVRNSKEPSTLFHQSKDWPTLPDFSHTMMYLDLLTYLPDDILAKVDRASMGVSLEARVPFLDPQILKFAWSLPLSFKIKKGLTKAILRKVLYKHIPKDLIERPKMGFSVPIDHWLRGPLKSWGEALIQPQRLNSQGYLNAPLVESYWKEHQLGKRNWQHHLWEVLMFQSWLEYHK